VVSIRSPEPALSHLTAWPFPLRALTWDLLISYPSFTNPLQNDIFTENYKNTYHIKTSAEAAIPVLFFTIC
jgi:hypothetical protein